MLDRNQPRFDKMFFTNIHCFYHSLKTEVCELYEDVMKFSVCGHLIWSTWAVIQAVSSQIEFDYMDYARQRVEQYKFVKYKI